MNQERQKYQSLAFSKHTPTAFIVGSPFQLLCAWNAIADFEILDYKIVLVLERKDVRNSQTLGMLQSRNMSYEIYYAEEFNLNAFLKGKMQRSSVLYPRVMVGEILDYIMLAIAGLYASDDSVLAYLDDGAASIRVLTGHSFTQNKSMAMLKSVLKRSKTNARQQKIEQYWKEVGLHDFGFFYTIYADINTKRFITYRNSFDKLRQLSQQTNKEETVLIIGALSDDFVETNRITMTEYDDLLRLKLTELRQRHPQASIIYIPHGRDKYEEVKAICDSLQIEYKKLDTTIELFALGLDMDITHIYGFTSTAHYTLKLITGAQVTLWLLMSKLTPSWYSINEIASYYKKHGIIIDEIPYPHTFIQAVRYYVERFKEICRIK